MKKVNIFSTFSSSFCLQASKKYLLFIFVTVILLVYGFSFVKVSAEENVLHIEVSGDINENTTWTKIGGPYLVTDDIYIPEGVTLTIEPGTIIKFEPKYNWDRISINVFGKIIADGTKENPIYFTSKFDDIGGSIDDDYYSCDYEDYVRDENGELVQDENGNLIGIGKETCAYYDWREPDIKDWDGFYLGFSIGSSFKNVFLKYAYDAFYIYSSDINFENLNISNSDSGITADEGSSIKIQDGYFDNLDEALQIYDNTLLEVSGISITNVKDGIYAYTSNSYKYDNPDPSLYTNNFLTIINSTIECTGDGIIVFNDYNLKIKGGNISCEGDGVTLFNDVSAEIDGVKIIGKIPEWETEPINTGIVAFDNTKPDSIKIVKSEITGNKYGFEIWDSVFSAHNNNIHNNTNKGVDAFSETNLDFSSNYWGDKTGPTHSTNPEGLGDTVSDYITFIPFLKSDPLIKAGPSSVLFIPGLEASRLYKQKSILGISTEDQLWEPNNNADVVDLFLNSDGTSINSNIYTRDIIKETNILTPTGILGFGLNIYKTFVNSMDALVGDGEDKMQDWKPFPYDWRQGVEDIINNGTQTQDGKVYLEDMLKELIDSSKSGKVTIVAHSNGGLIAKALIKKLQEDKIAGRNNLIDNIDVLILVAVPEIGTAMAVPAVMHGYDQQILGGWLLNEMNARELGRNMPSSYGLLPSREYMNRVSASPVTFRDNAIVSNVTTKLVQTFGTALDSYAEYKDFLFGGEGRVDPLPIETSLPIKLSENLFTKAEVLHDKIDNFIPPESLRVVEVAGWGLDTVASFEYYPKLINCGLLNYNGQCYSLDEKPRFTSDGDKTVVVPSAHYMGFLGKAEKYWVDLFKYNNDNFGRSHKNILEVSSLNNFIQSIIKKVDFNFDNDTVLKKTEPIDDSNRLRLSIHSPVTLDAYDIDGNHTGKICPADSDFCYVEEGIINSSYMEFGEGKYLNIPEDQVSTIKLQGTDIGSFIYEAEKVLPDGTSTTSSFVDIPVTTQTEAEITLNEVTKEPELKLDVTGDGVTDFTIGPKQEFDPILFLQVMKKTVESFDISKQQKTMLLKRIDDTIKAIQKGKISKAKLKIEQFKKVLTIHPHEKEKDRREREERNRREHEKEHREHKKPKALAQSDIQTLIIMLNQLLDNLN